MINIETWKPIKDYEELYKISNDGRIKSFHNGRERIMKLNPHTKGYLKVQLSFNGTIKAKYIHRLVAQAFIPNPNNYPQVNHKDENKSNNCVSNLEWCDNQYNINHATANQRRIKSLTNNKYTSKKVFQYTLEGQLIKIWCSVGECQRHGYNRGAVADRCRKKNIEDKQYKGFIWRYEERGVEKYKAYNGTGTDS